MFTFSFKRLFRGGAHKFDFITVGGACEDLSLFTDEAVVVVNKFAALKEKLLGFQYGGKIKIDEHHSTPGGGADNAAVALARLDFRVAAMVALGADERGEKLLNNLHDEGVNTSLVQIVKGEDTGFSPGIINKDHEHVFFPVRGANEKLKIGPKELRLLAQAEWLYLTSLSGNWQPILKKIFSVQDVKIGWNPGGSQILAGAKILAPYLQKTEVLIVNKEEAKKLVYSDKKYRKQKKSFFESPKQLVTALSKMGPKIVIVTLGEEGALAFDGRKYFPQEAFRPKKYINTIGVGDAFGSTFMAGMMLTKGNVAEAMKLAGKNSAAVVGKAGAQTGLLTRKELLKRRK